MFRIIALLTLPPLKRVGFSVQRQLPGVPGLTLSPRAFGDRSLPFPCAPRYASGQPVSRLSEQPPLEGSLVLATPTRPVPSTFDPAKDRIASVARFLAGTGDVEFSKSGPSRN